MKNVKSKIVLKERVSHFFSIIFTEGSININTFPKKNVINIKILNYH